MGEYEKTISVVIPLYNEEGNIPTLYQELKGELDKLGMTYEIIFVDDGSCDNTFDLLKELHKKDSNIRVIKFRNNFGQTAALGAGFNYAKGKVIITMDGDLQNDPGDIQKLLEKMERGYDAVSGWRTDRKDPITKKIPSKFSNWLARKLTGVAIHDFGCTLKAYKRETLTNLELYGEMHRHIPALLSWKGFKVGEVKVTHHPRRHGKTKYGTWRLIKGFLDLINLRFWIQYSTRPLHFFGVVGLSQLLIGGILGIYLTIARFFLGQSIANRPILLLSVLLIILGIQFITFGFLSEIMIRVYYGDVNRKSWEIEKVYE